MESIRRCPHCGGTPEVVGRKKIKVICKHCGASGAEKPLRSQAIENWNQQFILRCKDCAKYHEDIGWCDELSNFDEEDISKTVLFEKNEFCSRAVPRKREGNG